VHREESAGALDVLHGKVVGFGVTGSHCTFSQILGSLRRLVAAGARVIPVVTPTVAHTDTRFFAAKDFLRELGEITGEEPYTRIPDVEPFGPRRFLDVMVIAPLTGNSLARFANGITDNAVLMAAKSTLRNGRPVVLAVSTNDALGLNAPNLARLLTARYVYFVPFGQDDPYGKPTSLVAHMDLLPETVAAALLGRQLQPVLRPFVAREASRR